MKKLSLILALIILVNSINIKALTHETIYADADDTINNGYSPTQLANGDFETYPNKGTESATGGSDWQTTETEKVEYMKNNGYFEWINHTFIASGQTEFRYKQNYAINSSKGNFIEMNSKNPSTLYQNLNTNPGDIILWKLAHATRNQSGSPDVQEMEVWIGENGTDIPVGTNPNISKNLARYTYDGVTNTNGEYGYLANGIEDLNALKLNKVTDWQNDTDPWKIAKGVYTIPENQLSTRFAFTSITPGSTGNLLDDIVFETLLGNLKIDTSDPDNVIVTGYWAPIEENENVHLKYFVKDKNNNEIVVDGTVDMSKLRENNKTGFIVKIPYNGMSNDDYVLEISHEKYDTATIAQEFTIDDIESKNIVENKTNNNDNNETKKDKTNETNKDNKDVVNPKTYDSITLNYVLLIITSVLAGVLFKRNFRLER